VFDAAAFDDHIAALVGLHAAVGGVVNPTIANGHVRTLHQVDRAQVAARKGKVVAMLEDDGSVFSDAQPIDGLVILVRGMNRRRIAQGHRFRGGPGGAGNYRERQSEKEWEAVHDASVIGRVLNVKS
jgi:hypothetical protein